MTLTHFNTNDWADIKKIYGGNVLRVMRAVEQRSRELASMPPIESAVDKKD